MADPLKYCVREWYKGEVAHVYGGLSRKQALKLRLDRAAQLVKIGYSSEEALDSLEVMAERVLHRMTMEECDDQNG